MKTMDLDKVLSKVRGLLNKAEHPSTPEAEAKMCRAKADEMMTDYAVTQAQLRESAPAAEQARPGNIKIDLCYAASAYEIPITNLVSVVAEHCRCQVVFHNLAKTTQEARDFEEVWGHKRMVKVSVFGFESDLRYFELLFTLLHLHMSSGYDPKPDRSLTDEENAYVLHTAGLNWRAIARLFYPWHKMGWDGTHKENNWQRYGAYWSACYKRAVKARGENAVVLPKFSDSGASLINYRYNFANSYASTIGQRLTESRQGRSKSGELLLASSFTKIADAILEAFPDLQAVQYATVQDFNQAAWGAGRKHGQEADLNTNARVKSETRPELG
jgi:hypothetical protein